ncbi:phosphoribosylanthranilate isomerase [Halalkalibacter wakoensis JCM 9140]|uniref:N-(5'-phosphoribosyl)anthranilate isomerase n=1 Tax=Halalkalibacter wakoensis JCM 9140 TaxID=1236970 RepID=W4Q123_9BACI|nr:phosphoribosylanthranilate isomerase [Halalkalibacter wakoensis]GAE25074.1 phosphoribosylanthranilate isomerase [Halalkalibacter wakoensis JCM 9140]
MRPLLKLCGNHSNQDTNRSLQSSADYIGFVFAKSKRQVTREKVQDWLSNTSKNDKKIVALFVNERADQIEAALDGLPIDVIQCHGDESPEEVKEIKIRLALPIFKAIHHHEDALKRMKMFEGIASGYIVDCKVGNQWGGTGVSFDWTTIPSYLKEGKRQKVPVFIAGGIRPENVEEVLKYEPDGIDVSSGIEKNGMKSTELISLLEERVKSYDYNVPR